MKKAQTTMGSSYPMPCIERMMPMEEEARVIGSGPPGGNESLTTQLSKQGYASVPAFFSPVLVRGLRRELIWRDRQGQFSQAAIGQGDRKSTRLNSSH